MISKPLHIHTQSLICFRKYTHVIIMYFFFFFYRKFKIIFTPQVFYIVIVFNTYLSLLFDCHSILHANDLFGAHCKAGHT